MVKLSFKQIGGRGERVGGQQTAAVERHTEHTAVWAATVMFSAELSQARSFSFLEPKNNSCRRAAFLIVITNLVENGCQNFSSPKNRSSMILLYYDGADENHGDCIIISDEKLELCRVYTLCTHCALILSVWGNNNLCGVEMLFGCGYL